jgi:hypothetical protein
LARGLLLEGPKRIETPCRHTLGSSRALEESRSKKESSLLTVLCKVDRCETPPSPTQSLQKRGICSEKGCCMGPGSESFSAHFYCDLVHRENRSTRFSRREPVFHPRALRAVGDSLPAAQLTKRPTARLPGGGVAPARVALVHVAPVQVTGWRPCGSRYCVGYLCHVVLGFRSFST